MKLIEDWRRAHKFASMWIASAVAAIAVLEQFSPALHGWLPDWWPVAGAVLFAVARVLKQHGFDAPVSVTRIANSPVHGADMSAPRYVSDSAQVTLNGRRRTIRSPITYEELVDLANKVGHPTMTLRSDSGSRAVAPGDTVALFDGDVINVMHTDNA